MMRIPDSAYANHYAPLRTVTLMRKQLKRRLKSDYYAKFEHFYASLRIVTLTLGRGGPAGRPPLPSSMRNELAA